MANWLPAWYISEPMYGSEALFSWLTFMGICDPEQMFTRFLSLGVIF